VGHDTHPIQKIAPIDVASNIGETLDLESAPRTIKHCAFEECVQPTAKNRRGFSGIFD